MADMKISAMPAATQIANADIMPIVQGGANKKCTRQLMLTAAVGEDITILGASGQVINIFSDSGATTLVLDDGGGCVWTSDSMQFLSGGGGSSSFDMLATGDIAFVSPAGTEIKLDANAGGAVLILAPNVGGPSSLIDANGVVVSYLVAVSGDWNGAAPTDLAAAVDRCAALLKVLNGGVGP